MIKSVYKYELAALAGVSQRTFRRWMSDNRDMLSALGANPRQQLLPPKAVEWVCREYGIDL